MTLTIFLVALNLAAICSCVYVGWISDTSKYVQPSGKVILGTMALLNAASIVSQVLRALT